MKHITYVCNCACGVISLDITSIKLGENAFRSSFFLTYLRETSALFAVRLDVSEIEFAFHIHMS
jgi:hypothetical protein